ncbi:MAG: hypothetical protein Q4Q58_05615 [Thermoplasmata archaeon]|nr:hypothetical protein [Thermoplasmata archaeon]
MVYLGRTKFGLNNRISLVGDLPDLLHLEVGDYVEFIVSDGKVYIQKATHLYRGLDIEKEDIEEGLRDYEKRRIDDEGLTAGDINSEDNYNMALEEYMREKKQRESRKKSEKKG